MFSNNPKVASFYPTNKRPNTNFYNHSLTNTLMTNSSPNNMSFIDNQALNFQEKSISDSVELALITVNLSYTKFKSMNREELDNYVKIAAYNNSYESKKFLLALNILIAEIDKTHNNVIKQQLPLNKNINKNYNQNYNQNNNSHFDFQEKKINMNEVICIEPDEFNLNTHMDSSDNFSNYTNDPILQTMSFFNNSNNSTNSNNSYNSNTGQKFSIKQNRNLDMSTFSGNPLGTFKITNSQPVNSLRPINQSHKNDLEIINQHDNISNNTNITTPVYLSNQNLTSRFTPQFNYTSSINNNNIIQQTSTLSNPMMFQGNGGRRRTSNMDVTSSNDYVIIK